MKLVQGLLEVCKCPWLCENSERALTERNRVLPAPRFPRCLATARDDIGAGEEGHSMRSACPSVLTRPRPTADLGYTRSSRRSIFQAPCTLTPDIVSVAAELRGDRVKRREFKAPAWLRWHQSIARNCDGNAPRLQAPASSMHPLLLHANIRHLCRRRHT